MVAVTDKVEKVPQGAVAFISLGKSRMLCFPTIDVQRLAPQVRSGST